MLLLHYSDLKADFPGEARRVAAFLDIDVPEDLWPAILEHCEIGYMRELSKGFEVLDVLFDGGGANFIHKGTNGRWRDTLSAEEVARCDEVAIRELGEECARWLSGGTR